MVATLTARAESTAVAGDWGPVNAATLHGAINEGTPDDNTRIRSDPGGQSCTLVLNPEIDPNLLRIRASKSTPEGERDLLVEILDGAGTVVATRTVEGLTTDETTYEFSLTAPEKQAITDYGLSVRLTATDPMAP